MLCVPSAHDIYFRLVLKWSMAACLQGRFSFYMTSAGEEATAIGSAEALQPEDVVTLILCHFVSLRQSVRAAGMHWGRQSLMPVHSLIQQRAWLSGPLIVLIIL